MAPISRACSRKRRGCAAQSSKSARGLSNAAPRTRGSSAATQVAIEPPVLVPTSQIPVGVASPMRWSIAARRSSTQPCSEKSPSLVPQPRKLNVIAAQPSSLAMRSISSGNVPALWRASSGPIGKPWHRITPGSGPWRPAGARQVAGELEVAGAELAVHAVLTLAACGARRRHARLGQRVAAVARLGQRVGPEAQTGLGGDDLVDDRRVVPLVEVVDQLRALVAEVPGVLEARRPLHRARR